MPHIHGEGSKLIRDTQDGWIIKNLLLEDALRDERCEMGLDSERTCSNNKLIKSHSKNTQHSEREHSWILDREYDRKRGKYGRELSRDGCKGGSRGSKGGSRDRESDDSWQCFERGGEPKSVKTDKEKDGYSEVNETHGYGEVDHLANNCETKRSEIVGLNASVVVAEYEAIVHTSFVFRRGL